MEVRGQLRLYLPPSFEAEFLIHHAAFARLTGLLVLGSVLLSCLPLPGAHAETTDAGTAVSSFELRYSALTVDMRPFYSAFLASCVYPFI